MNESNWRFHALVAAACGNRIIERDFLHVLTLSLRIAHLAYAPGCSVSPAGPRTRAAAVPSWDGCGSWTPWHAT